MSDSPTSSTDPIINIRGELVGLGPLDASMLDTLTRWINDFQSVRTVSMSPRPMTAQKEQEWLDRILTSDSTIMFAIYDLDDMHFVGTTGLFDIDDRHRSCELGIAIMDRDRRGKGLGTDAVRLITDYAIHGLELHNIQLATYEFNYAGQRAYAKAGFKEYGRRREAILHGGRRWDMIYMDVIASEWESPVMRELMAPDEPHSAG